MSPDPWQQGYTAAKEYGADYSQNPFEHEPAGTAWAFGCSEGMKERNRITLDEIVRFLQC